MMSKETILCLVAFVSTVYGGTLMEELANVGATTVADLLKSTGLDKDINNDYLTLFAPSNEAFAALPDDLTKTLATNSTVLLSVLKFHSTHGIFRSQDAFNDMLLDTNLAGSKVRVNVYKDASGSPLFITLNGAKVLRANLPASNGVLHVIDSVMLPPLGTFYNLVEQSQSHTILKQIIDDLGLRSALETYTGTFFAPTDTAFANFESVMKARNADISTPNSKKEILMYHLVGNVIYSAGAENGTYTTLDHGEKVTVTVAADRSVYKINQATVLLGDIPATNGMLHIVDSVLVPEPYATTLVIGK